ncbi:ribosome assembly cofactor RimP [Maribellus comscasis]|uniref:Ribosome maturation factor RimP n=1 Tax=Maribellus comscasis TaxID=2681766 RepID=A0A6I6JME6_9BACT|nr:ribosome assembly cofactor RimP [Maribellus comscasis]QGY43551.1 ribosome assembly cofactor RimP [Maribellus comscasis]
MIDKEKVIKLVEEKLDEKMFLVDVSVNKSNVINVYVDSFDGMTIEKCIEISRNVEHNLDRDVEDFELQVSSPGLTEGFKVRQQYIKYQNREIEVDLKTGEHFEGVLKEVDDDKIILETSKREKVEGHKKKQLVVREHNIKYNEIKSAKAVITFK